MTYKELKRKFKDEQKSLAQAIRNGKTGRKPKNMNSSNIADLERLDSNKDTYRHQHIIYCTLFNKTPYEVIEQPRDNNAPSTYYLDQIKNKWKAELNEIICNRAQ